MLRDYDRGERIMTQEKNMLWLVARALIDAPFWYVKKAKLNKL